MCFKMKPQISAALTCWKLKPRSSSHTLVLHLFLIRSSHPSESFLWNLQVCVWRAQTLEGRFCVPALPAWAIWWRSPRSPLRNTTLGDLVVSISVATSLKWRMIMNPTGGEVRLICIHPRPRMHKYQSINTSPSSRVSGDLGFIRSVSVTWTPRWRLAYWNANQPRGARQGHRGNARCRWWRVCENGEGTPFICIRLRWLTLVGSCSYGDFYAFIWFDFFFFLNWELKPRCLLKETRHVLATLG